MERRNQIKKAIKDNRLLLGVLAGVIGGCIIGISSHEAVQSSSNPSPKRLAMYIKFHGELFNRMLKMMLIPLITSSVIVALAEIELSSAGRLGKRTMIYYVTTTVLSAKIGLILAAIIKPGSEVNEKNEASKNIHWNSMDSFLDLLRNVFPDNLVGTFINSVYTDYQEKVENYSYESRNISLPNVSAEAMAKLLKSNQVVSWLSEDGHVTVIKADITRDFGGVAKSDRMNVIGLIVFSTAFGVVLNIIRKEGESLVNLLRSLWSATMKLVEMIMWLPPVGICSVVAGNIVETKEISLLFHALGIYVLTNIVGHLIQALAFYPVLYIMFVRRNPLRHLKSILPALLTAFGTSSSAATLPTTIECCESKAKIDKRVTRFVLPIGATCNMDGAAIYFAITVLFIEQIGPNVQLGIGDKILAILMSTFVSIGAAGIPSPGLTNLIVVLEAVGLPVDKVGPIFAVDWLLDRVGTTINVMGDTYAAAIVGKYYESDLKEARESGNDYSDIATGNITKDEETVV